MTKQKLPPLYYLALATATIFLVPGILATLVMTFGLVFVTDFNSITDTIKSISMLVAAFSILSVGIFSLSWMKHFKKETEIKKVWLAVAGVCVVLWGSSNLYLNYSKDKQKETDLSYALELWRGGFNPPEGLTQEDLMVADEDYGSIQYYLSQHHEKLEPSDNALLTIRLMYPQVFSFPEDFYRLTTENFRNQFTLEEWEDMIIHNIYLRYGLEMLGNVGETKQVDGYEYIGEQYSNVRPDKWDQDYIVKHILWHFVVEDGIYKFDRIEVLDEKPVALHKISLEEQIGDLTVRFNSQVIKNEIIDGLAANEQVKQIIKSYLRDKYQDEEKAGQDFLSENFTALSSTDQKEVYSSQTSDYYQIGNYFIITYKTVADYGDLHQLWMERSDSNMTLTPEVPAQLNTADVFDLTTGRMLTLVDIFEDEEAYKTTLDNALSEGGKSFNLPAKVFSGSFTDTIQFRLVEDGIVFILNPMADDEKLVELLVPYSETKLEIK